MFSRQLTEKTTVSLSIPHFADELFALTDRNRAFLREWLPWLDFTKTADDTRAFLTGQLQAFARGESLHLTIFQEGVVAGVAGFNSLDRTNQIGYIGYWLGQEFNGKGIMTEVVRDLVTIGREYYGLQKIDIRCATGNRRSRAIPERLGFTHEGTLRRAERVYDQWLDHEVYALLIEHRKTEERQASAF
jgi:ribosomal-protein-serine acetyltransferase